MRRNIVLQRKKVKVLLDAAKVIVVIPGQERLLLFPPLDGEGGCSRERAVGWGVASKFSLPRFARRPPPAHLAALGSHPSPQGGGRKEFGHMVRSAA